MKVWKQKCTHIQSAVIAAAHLTAKKKILKEQKITSSQNQEQAPASKTFWIAARSATAGRQIKCPKYGLKECFTWKVKEHYTAATLCLITAR